MVKKTGHSLRSVSTYGRKSGHWVSPYANNHFNIFNIRTTEDEKQELSDKPYEFHDAYENSFADYFDESEELEDFMSCYKGLYDLIDTLMDRW